MRRWKGLPDTNLICERGRTKRRGGGCLALLLLLVWAAGLGGCGGKEGRGVRQALAPVDVSLFEYHVRLYKKDLEEFVTRLYARNPKYETDVNLRRQKIAHVFHGKKSNLARHDHLSSSELLTLAFAPDTEGDRVLLLAAGLVKSIREAYALDERGLFVTGLQIPPGRLQRLHYNMSQVNWRLKTYRDAQGDLLFLTNGMADNGYLNMGYEVIMTRILTRIEDDIYLRGGLPEMYFFGVSTFFLSIVM